MTMAVEAAAMKDLRKVERAALRKAKALGIEPEAVQDDINEYDRASYGRAVRLEIDVCIPIADLRKDLQSARNKINDALAAIDKYPTPDEKRHASHRLLSRAKAEIYYRKREREMRDLRKPQPQQ